MSTLRVTPEPSPFHPTEDDLARLAAISTGRIKYDLALFETIWMVEVDGVDYFDSPDIVRRRYNAMVAELDRRGEN